MRKLLFILLIPFTAFASPVDGMIGKTIPQFLVYVPFTQEVTICRKGDDRVTTMVRTYAYSDGEGNKPVMRKDQFVGTVIIAHYLPGIDTLFYMENDRVTVVHKDVKEWGEPTDHCASIFRGR